MAAYGTLEEVADMIYQVINRGDTSLVSDTTKQLMDATLTEIKSFNGHIIKDFVDSIDSEMDSFKDSSIAAEVEKQVKDFRE
jgi:hypothetical protein